MRTLLVYLALLATATASLADHMPAGEVNVDTGRIIVNGQKIEITRRYDGKQLELHNEHIVASAGKNPGLFLSIYRDKANPTQQFRTEHIIIIDASGKDVRRSNVLDTGVEFDWGDNNYVTFGRGAMYFGIYTPKRMQFVYKDGKVEENKGPWRGPSKPEIYIEPTGDDPCGNVNGVEDCREEVAREKAKHVKPSRKANKQIATATLTQ